MILGFDFYPEARAGRTLQAVTGFPYRIVYFVEDDLLTVVAVAHSKRRPGYWRDRVSL